MYKVLVPLVNNNEDTYTLSRWLVKDGQQVAADDLIASVESTKATVELAADQAGVVHHAVAQGAAVAFGDVAAYIFADEAERAAFLAQGQPAAPQAVAACTITKAARELMDQHGIAEALVLALGKKIVTKADVEPLIGAQDAQDAGGIALSKRQIGIGEVVSRSYHSIPRAFLAMKVYLDAALAALADLSASSDCMIGLTELLVQQVALLQPQYPLFYGGLAEPGRFLPADGAHVGVTMDGGRGLFIPVVRDAAARSLPEIADTLMDFRIKALRNSFQPEDLAGGAITISLNVEPDTLFVLPIILPDQAAMLSLGAEQEELYLAEGGAVARRRFVTLGLAYDHRVINGYEAAQWMKALKAQVEQARLADVGAAQ